ncbi:ribonucleotide-diphosphate reductase subunit alpha [Listeria floridensis FSL S10-1187]|uniref:Ribonucleotide-diphosphate reductase subunit alpha n=1 Tax=Listeria floridensis FSL S10-1187 TaxID=1265817 RepID=A0ABP3B0C3_9LIST|nr:ribonucleotide-diphosphate reductase subunit alpha [Listeria floridensis FSL S10-1187]
MQDFYDEEKGEGSFREKYEELVADETISKKNCESNRHYETHNGQPT